jgi:hypothetical protein
MAGSRAAFALRIGYAHRVRANRRQEMGDLLNRAEGQLVLGGPRLRSARRIACVQGRRPTKTKLGDVAKNIVTLWHCASLHPGYEIFEGALPHCTVEPAVRRLAH